MDEVRVIGKTSVFDLFQGVPGGYSHALSEQGVVRAQAFKESVVFYLTLAKNGEAYLYKGPKEVYYRKGELKGVHNPARPDAEPVVVIPLSGKMVKEAVDTSDFSQIFFSVEREKPKEIDLDINFVN